MGNIDVRSIYNMAHYMDKSGYSYCTIPMTNTNRPIWLNMYIDRLRELDVINTILPDRSLSLQLGGKGIVLSNTTHLVINSTFNNQFNGNLLLALKIALKTNLLNAINTRFCVAIINKLIYLGVIPSDNFSKPVIYSSTQYEIWDISRRIYYDIRTNPKLQEDESDAYANSIEKLVEDFTRCVLYRTGIQGYTVFERNYKFKNTIFKGSLKDNTGERFCDILIRGKDKSLVLDVKTNYKILNGNVIRGEHIRQLKEYADLEKSETSNIIDMGLIYHGDINNDKDKRAIEEIDGHEDEYIDGPKITTKVINYNEPIDKVIHNIINSVTLMITGGT